jgi:hypothetical protein
MFVVPTLAFPAPQCRLKPGQQTWSQMRHLWQTILVSLLLTTGLATAAEPAVKIALFAVGDGRAEAVAGLATARLSTAPGVILLERDDIRRVLAEQHLAADGLLSGDALARLGQLLNCDVFAVIQIADSAGAVPPRPGAASLTAFDAGTGVRLAAQTLDPAATPEDLTDAVVAATTLALRKWHALGQPGQGRTIALLSIRTAGLNPAMGGLPERLSLALDQALLATPEFTLLERQRLDRLNTEAALVGDRRTNLLASSVLLELDLASRDEKDGFTLRASINTVDGKEIGSFVVNGTGTDSETAAQAFVQALRKQLAAPRPNDMTVTDRRREAERHSAESQRLVAANQYMAAVVPAQTALALAPDDPIYAYYFCDVAEKSVVAWLNSNNQATALEVLAQVLDVRERYGTSINMRLEMALLNLYRKSPQFSPAEKAKLDDLRRRYRLYAKKFQEAPESGNWWLLQQMFCAGSADDWFAQALPAIKDQDFLWESLIGWNSVFMGHARKPGNYVFDLLYDLRDLSPKNKRDLLAFFEQQAANGRTLETRLDGYFCAAQVAAQFPREIPDATAVYTRQIRTAVDLIVAGVGTPQDRNGRAYYQFAEFCFCPSPHDGPGYVYDPQAMPKLLLAEGQRIAAVLEARKLPTQDVLGLLEGLASAIRRTAPAEVPPAGYFIHNDKTAAKLDDVPAAWWAKTELRYAVPPGCVILGIAPDYETGDYFLLVCRDGPYEQFIRRVAVGDKTSGAIITNVPTKTGRDRSYPSLHYRGPENFNASRGFPFQVVAGEKAVYASEAGTVLAWPRDGGEPWVIRVPPGLGGVTSLVQVGDHLYWGLTGSGGCLARSTWRGENFEILAASGRRETHSSLDNRTGYAIRGLTWDKPRNRVVFLTAMMAVWELNLQTQEIRCLLVYSDKNSSAYWIPSVTLYSNHEWLVMEGAGLSCLWNYETDRIDVLLDGWNTVMFSGNPGPPPREFYAPEELGPNWGPAVRIGDILYYTDANRKPKWYRLSRFAGPPPKHDALPVLADNESPFFMVASGKQLLACTRQNLWLLTPPVSK